MIFENCWNFILWTQRYKYSLAGALPKCKSQRYVFCVIKWGRYGVSSCRSLLKHLVCLLIDSLVDIGYSLNICTPYHFIILKIHKKRHFLMLPFFIKLANFIWILSFCFLSMINRLLYLYFDIHIITLTSIFTWRKIILKLSSLKMVYFALV